MTEKEDLQSNKGSIMTNLLYIRRDIDEIKKQLEQNYVTHDEFEPVKKVVYGLVGVVLIGVMTAVVALVIT